MFNTFSLIKAIRIVERRNTMAGIIPRASGLSKKQR